MSALALKLYSWYNTYIVDSHQLRNFANGRCLPCVCVSLGDLSSLRSSKQGFCCQYLHLRPFGLALQVPCFAMLENLHRPSSNPPCELRSFLAAARRGLKMNWRKGAWRWLSCGSTCVHPVLLSLLPLWVSSPLVWLLGLKSCLPPAYPCTHQSFLGWGSSSWNTKEMFKLPLQLTEGERHLSKEAKLWL